MYLDFGTFLDRLAAWMAGRTSPALAYATTPRALWIHAADESFATTPYSVLSIYGGEYGWVPRAKLSVQCMTVGKSAAGTMAMATALFNMLLDSAGQPVRKIDLTGFRILGIDPRPPGVIGVDEAGRHRVSTNFEISVVPRAA